MNKFLVPAALATACALSFAKLPPPDDAAKARAAETAARQAWQAKVDAFQLCKSQDKIAARYRKTSATAPAKDAKAAPASPVAPIAPATTAAAAPPAPCADPGPFAYNPPEQKPLETAGAHSPSGTAASPPNVNAPSAQMAPAKK